MRILEILSAPIPLMDVRINEFSGLYRSTLKPLNCPLTCIGLLATNSSSQMPPKKQKSKLTQLYKKALPHFEVAYKENLQDPALRDALMNIYYQLGDGKKLKEIESKH